MGTYRLLRASDRLYNVDLGFGRLHYRLPQVSPNLASSSNPNIQVPWHRYGLSSGLNVTYDDPCSSLPRIHFRIVGIRYSQTTLPGLIEGYYPIFISSVLNSP